MNSVFELAMIRVRGEWQGQSSYNVDKEFRTCIFFLRIVSVVLSETLPRLGVDADWWLTPAQVAPYDAAMPH
jgi:hypothetical protein